MNRFRTSAWWVSAALALAASAANAAWLTPAHDAPKRRVESAALMPVSVDVSALFAQGAGETQTIEVNAGRTLALTTLRTLE